MTDTARKNPPAARGRVVRELRAVVAGMHSTISRWNCGGRVWDGVRRHEDGQPCTCSIAALASDYCRQRHVSWRKREIAEFPENDRAAWMRLATDARLMRLSLQDVESYAMSQVYDFDEAARRAR
jgi:predicted NUDIX family NTP pyrophosphohydrolase